MNIKSLMNSTGKNLLFAVVFIRLSTCAFAYADKIPGDTAGETYVNDFLKACGDSLQGEQKTYKVKKGDSLWKIGNKYSVSVKELKKLNGLKSGRLKPGQELILAEPRVPEVKSVQTRINLDSGIGPEKGNGADGSKHTAAEEFIMFVTGRTLGIPYRFGSSSMKATDCSGYVQKVFSFMGIQLPRSAREQFDHGWSVDKGDLSIGDLVFFRTYASFPSHVGIYLGNNLFVHASAFARKVTIDNLNTPYFIKRFVGAKRLFDKDSIQSSPAISAAGPQ